MSYCLSLGIAFSVALWTAPGEPGPAGARTARPSTVEVPSSTILAQFGDLGGLLQAGSEGRSGRDRERQRRSGEQSGESHGPTIRITPPSTSHGEGGHSPIIPIPIPIPTRPTYPGYYPPYQPRPSYTPRPPTRVPSNMIPEQPPELVPPETNVVLVKPESNDFTKDLTFRPITAKELQAFKDQITKKNQELGEELKKLFAGNEPAIDQLLDLANNGKLDAKALQGFVAAFGGGLNVQQQLQATGLLKQLAFNNIALGVLLNVNINNLNISITNINLVNVNINVNVLGGAWIGFWGFPWWPWNYPIWLGPGIWWGPCVYCPYPYYNPNLTGADALGVPYSIADPVPDYPDTPVTSGILLANAGGAAVNYTLDGQPFSMPPDYRQTIARRSLVVAFDRGGSFGQAKYRVDEGWYKFTATDRGWELYKHTAKVTLDNTDNPFEFKYVLDNQRQSLPSGYQKEHTGKYPLVLRFDNGKGQTKQKVLEKGAFQIALSGEGTLDLFRPEDVTMPAPIAEMAKQADEQTKNIFAEPDKIPNLFGDATAGAKTLGPQPTTSPDAPPPPPPPGVPSLFGNE